MKINLSALASDLDSIWKVTETILKFATLVGAMCVVGYSLRIDYFPKDLSVSDGLLFVIAAACFGVTYIIFVGSLIALGVSLSPPILGVIKLIWRIRKKPLEWAYEPAPFSWLALVCSLFSLLIIFAFAQSDSFVYLNLFGLAIGLYFFYSVYRSSGQTLKEIEEADCKIVKATENDSPRRSAETLKEARFYSLWVILFTPLFVAGVFGQLLDGAMRLANVRAEKVGGLY